MSALSINTSYDIIKLNYKEVVIENYEKGEYGFTFTISGRNKYGFCTFCGKKTKLRKDLKEYVSKSPIKHIWMSDGRNIDLITKRRYFRFKHCGKEFMEYFSFDSLSGRHTQDFQDYILYGWGHMSGIQMARDTNCSPSKIHKILSKIDSELINKNGIKLMSKLDKIYLGIDEHSFRGKDMILVIVELKEKKPVAILNDTTNKTLDNWINSLPPNIKEKIVGISTDMHKGYKNVFERNISGVLSTVDKYHLVQEANRMVDEVRQLNKRLIETKLVKKEELIKYGKLPKKVIKTKEKLLPDKELKTNKYKDKVNQILDKNNIIPKDLKKNKGDKIEYKEITLGHFLNCGYRTIFLKREENLSGYQKLRIRQILKEYDYKGYVAEAWVAKERFITALDELDIEEIKDVMNDCLTSEHYRIRTFGRTLKRWGKQFETYCKYSTELFKFTNATTESINNQCKVAKRVSHGFKNKDNYKKKLSSRFYLDRHRK